MARKSSRSFPREADPPPTTASLTGLFPPRSSVFHGFLDFPCLSNLPKAPEDQAHERNRECRAVVFGQAGTLNALKSVPIHKILESPTPSGTDRIIAQPFDDQVRRSLGHFGFPCDLTV